MGWAAAIAGLWLLFMSSMYSDIKPKCEAAGGKLFVTFSSMICLRSDAVVDLNSTTPRDSGR